MGTDEPPFFSRYDGLMCFRLTPLGAYCLDVKADYQPAPIEVKPVLRVLPNLEIAATGPNLEQSDRLALDAYATPVSDFVWRLEASQLLAAIDAGRQIAEIRAFLAARSGTALPDTVARLLDDVAGRTTLLQDRGLARLIECADAALGRIDRQRHADPQALHACRGTPPGGDRPIGCSVPACIAGRRLSSGSG